MLRTLATRHARRRSGAVLIVVLAMLVLFAVLGLSFVLYSEAQLGAARNQKISVNQEAEPNPLLAAEGWMGPFIYDVSDTGNDLANPIRAHSLVRSKYSLRYDETTGLLVTTLLPYSAHPMTAEPPGFNFDGITDSRRIVRHTWDLTTNSVYDPERFYNANMAALRQGAGAYNTRLTAANGVYQGKNYSFTYPDRHDFYLAQINPITGEVVTPSFHRDDLFGQLNPPGSATPNPNWSVPQGRLLTLRPHAADHTFDPNTRQRVAMGTAGSQMNFPPVPQNPDGTYTGDVANLKFIGLGSGQRNDSLWMYAGGPVLKWRGKNYAACVAPLVLDLSSRVNLSTAGNVSRLLTTPATPHGSKDGLGPWEVNPLQLGLTAADLQAVIERRHGRPTGTVTPPVDPYTLNAFTTRINGARMPHQGALLDADANGPAAGGAKVLPVSGAFQTTPGFNGAAAVASPFRYEPTTAEFLLALQNHPAQFNPLLHARTPNAAGAAGGFGHDDLIRQYARFSDPKNRQAGTTSVPQGTTLAANAQLRALTTTFNVTQQWASVPVVSDDPSGFSRLGPVDLNRPLPDYRKNPAIPHSPVNIWSTVGVEQPFWYAAHSARQRLARDIFIRLAARYGLINGTSAIYRVATGNVQVLSPEPPAADPTGNREVLMRLAQLAVNLVDYIDGDDIVTPFVWRPIDASLADPSNDQANYIPSMTNNPANRVVYGTEQPRLVLNEVYSGVFSDRTEEATPPAMNRSQQPLKRRYWIELYNPSATISTSSPGLVNSFTDPTLSDAGAARLRYDPATTQLLNPLNPSGPTVAAPFASNPYRIEVATVAAGTSAPYAAALQAAVLTGGYGAASTDPQTVLGATGVVQARVNSFVPAVANPLLVGDAANLILPATGTTGANGGNIGYYLIGPQDPFPTAPVGGVTSSMSLNDPPVAGVPPTNPPLNGPVDALTFDATAAAPADADIATEQGKNSTVILRRLLNPYLPAQEDPALANFNPYITVDFLENLPTRDRAMFNSVGGAMPRPQGPSYNLPTVGRLHPFAAFPDYGAVNAAVADQVNGAITMSPPHTFFNINSNADNARGGATGFGFEWMVHLDRELVSLPEAATASRTSPALLTHAFYGGTPGTYQGHIVGLNNPILVNINGNAVAIRMLSDAEGLLACGSRLPGVPLGGRQSGKVNINTVNDPRVLNAVFDPQAGNGFAATNPGYTTNLWNSISPATPPVGPVIARTPNQVPRATVHEGGIDHPLAWGHTTRSTTSAFPDRDHPFGRPADTTAPNGLIFPNFAASTHPYLLGEPLQKGWNNLTSTSDSFLVVMTVGFFEVENAGPWNVTNQPVLGREMFDKVPGDLRAQFAGVIDRSQLFTQIAQNDVIAGTSAVFALPGDPTTSAAPRGVQSRLVADVQPGDQDVHIEALPPGGIRPDGVPVAGDTCALLGDGVVFLLGPNSRLRVGYGDSQAVTGTKDDGEWLTLIPSPGGAVPPPVPPPTPGNQRPVIQRSLPDATGLAANYQIQPGQVTLRLAVPATRFHAAGSPVGNVLFGNPGPQPGVSLKQLKDRGLVPYFTRLEP